MKTNKPGKFLWSVEWRDALTWQLIAPMSFIKVDCRPQLTLEESNFGTWIPGKGSWQETKLIYPDVENDEGAALFFNWVSKQYKNEEKSVWTPEKTALILRLHDASGKPIELWYLENALVTSMNFGDLSYPGTLDVSVKYTDVSYSTADPATWLKPLTESSSSF